MEKYYHLQKIDLNSNIEIHKSIIFTILFSFFNHLNSNIEIHKSITYQIYNSFTFKFKF